MSLEYDQANVYKQRIPVVEPLFFIISILLLDAWRVILYLSMSHRWDLPLSDDRNWIAFWLLNCSKFIPQNFVILTFLNVNKEVEMSAAWFMIEINQEGGILFAYME